MYFQKKEIEILISNIEYFNSGLKNFSCVISLNNTYCLLSLSEDEKDNMYTNLFITNKYKQFKEVEIKKLVLLIAEKFNTEIYHLNILEEKVENNIYYIFSCSFIF